MDPSAMSLESYMAKNHKECVKIERNETKIVECIRKGRFNQFVNESEKNSSL